MGETSSRPTRKSRVLVVDDQLSMAETLAEGLVDRGYAATAVSASGHAASLLSNGDDIDLLVTDLRMPSGAIGFSGAIVPMREMQRRYAAWAYEQLGGRKMDTAEKLGVDFKTLNKWLTEEL